MGLKVGGYTIIEVMIFLAISAVIFLAATLAFNGQQGQTQFQAGLRDLSSQMQQYVDQVGTGIFNGSGQYNCAISNSTDRAILSSGTNSVGTNQGCIFLGRAMEVVPTQPNLYIYTVLGSQYSASGESVTSLTAAMPEPAMDAPADLTDQYNTPWATVVSSNVTSSSGTVSASDMVGFYNSLQDGYQNSGASGSQSITAKGYNFTSSTIDNRSGVKSCIEEQGTCANTPSIDSWSVCFASTASSQKAILTVSSTPGGITTNLNFTSCS